MLCTENGNVNDIKEVLLKFKSQFVVVTQRHGELIATLENLMTWLTARVCYGMGPKLDQNWDQKSGCHAC